MNQIALLRNSINATFSKLRKKYFCLLGLKIGKSGFLGKIICDWPHTLKIGSNCTIQDGVRFEIKNPFSGENVINIGNRVFVGYGCTFNCTSKIIISDDCLIASGTSFADISHLSKVNIPINKQKIISEDIFIEEDVWIGTGCIILKGVSIGKGSIIGAGSLVNKSIPSNQIWAGIPAKYIRER